MISTTAPLPLPAPAHDDFAPSGSPNAARDDSGSLSFSSHLDQQISRHDTQRARSADARPPAAAPDEAASSPDADDAQTSAASPADASLTGSAAPELAAEQGDQSGQPLAAKNAVPKRAALTSKGEDKTEDKAQADTSANNAPASMLPLMPAALAIVTGIVPAPAAPVPVTKSANGQAGKTVIDAVNAADGDTRSKAGANAASPRPVASSVADGTSTGQSGVSVVSADTLPAAPANAVATLQAGVAAPATPTLALPLTSSGVPMDSRANGQTAAPGVANALPQTASSNPAAVNTPAHIQPSEPSAGPAVGLPPADGAFGTANTPPVSNAEGPPAPGNAGVIQAASAPVPSSLAVFTPGAQADAVPLTPTSAPPAPAPQGATVLATPASASEKSISEKPASATVSEQRLDGISRVLTLNSGKAASAENSTAAKRADIAAPDGAKPADTLASAAHSAQASGVTGVPASADAPLKSVSAPDAAGVPSAGQPTGLANAGTDAGAGVSSNTGSAMGGSVLPRPGSLPQVLASGQAVVGSPASALTSDASSVTAGTGALGAVPPSVGASSSGADAGGQEQSEAQDRPRADITPSSDTAGADGSTAANSLTAARETNGTAAAASSAAPNGSSQIDRAHVVAQVTRHLEGMRLSGGNGEMSLRLAPQHLGSVQVTVAAHQDGVVARIAVESVQVQQAMESAKEHLRGTLEARGLHVRTVEVTVTPHPTGQDSAAYNGQRNRQANAERADMPGSYVRRDASRITPADSPASAPASMPTAALSASRLDYRA